MARYMIEFSYTAEAWAQVGSDAAEAETYNVLVTAPAGLALATRADPAPTRATAPAAATRRARWSR